MRKAGGDPKSPFPQRGCFPSRHTIFNKPTATAPGAPRGEPRRHRSGWAVWN